MKILLIYAFTLLAITFPAMAEMAKDDAGSMPPLEGKSPATLVMFHSDICAKCKILDPKIEEVMASLSEEDKNNLKVVKFDFTNDKTAATSASIAGKNGLSDLYQHFGPKTGFAVLYKDGIAMDDQEMLKADDNVESIQEKIEVYIHDQVKLKG